MCYLMRVMTIKVTSLENEQQYNDPILTSWIVLQNCYIQELGLFPCFLLVFFFFWRGVGGAFFFPLKNKRVVAIQYSIYNSLIDNRTFSESHVSVNKVTIKRKICEFDLSQGSLDQSVDQFTTFLETIVKLINLQEIYFISVCMFSCSAVYDSL